MRWLLKTEFPYTKHTGKRTRAECRGTALQWGHHCVVLALLLLIPVSGTVGVQHLQRGDARNQQEWSLSQSPPNPYVEAFLHKSVVSPGIAFVMSLWTPIQKVWWDAINIHGSERNLWTMQGREVCMLQSWLLFAVTLYSQRLHPDRVSGVCIEEREAAHRTALGMCKFP